MFCNFGIKAPGQWTCFIGFSNITGVVELVSDFVVCEEGKPLSPEAARILVSYFYLLFPASSILLVLTFFIMLECLFDWQQLSFSFFFGE